MRKLVLPLAGLIASSGAGMAQESETRTLGPIEMRVWLKDAEGQTFPPEQVKDVTVLVEPLSAEERGAERWERHRPPAEDPGPGRGARSRQIEMTYVADGSAEPLPAGASRQSARNDAGYAATMVFVERGRGEEEKKDEEAPGGGYYRAVYEPRADERVIAVGALVYFTHEGLTRTVRGFRYPQAQAPGARGGEAENGMLETRLEAIEKEVRERDWDAAAQAADRFEQAIGPAESNIRRELRADVDDLRQAVNAQDRDYALRKIGELRKGVARLDGAGERPMREAK